MMIDGRGIAEEIYARLEAGGGLRGTRLGIICCEPNAVIESFVRIKQKAAQRLGIELVREDVARHDGTTGIIDVIARLVPQTQGIIVQLPLPAEIDVDAVLAALPGTHDVDGIGGEARVLPPVACAVREILTHADLDIAGKKAVVIGAGRLVGAPAAKMLEAAGAQVQVVTKEAGSLSELAQADIIVSGAGEPGMITPDMISEGVALIDAGTSEQDGKVRGDADPACAPKCAVFTPVPGGVGPVAVAEIFENLGRLIGKRG
jgi:methylenetetrahydrofolate dehydrogenase (NADP+)/methenyltetrahydrofolate cyclohydrolase